MYLENLKFRWNWPSFRFMTLTNFENISDSRYQKKSSLYLIRYSSGCSLVPPARFLTMILTELVEIQMALVPLAHFCYRQNCSHVLKANFPSGIHLNSLWTLDRNMKWIGLFRFKNLWIFKSVAAQQRGLFKKSQSRGQMIRLKQGTMEPPYYLIVGQIAPGTYLNLFYMYLLYCAFTS